MPYKTLVLSEAVDDLVLPCTAGATFLAEFARDGTIGGVGRPLLSDALPVRLKGPGFQPCRCPIPPHNVIPSKKIIRILE